MAEHFELDAACGLGQMEEVHAALVADLAGRTGGRWTIDASQVRETDVSLVQLLLAARKSAAVKGVEMELVGSPVLSDLMRRAGAETSRADPAAN